MLKTLDILIGIATVMLLFSMVVTIVTQAIISAVQTRGRNLRDGLAGLLKQLDPEIDDKITSKISTALLRHPLIGGKLGALGTVIHRDEFTTLLMEMAAGQSSADVTPEAKAAVVKLLQKNGVNDPAGALKNIRDVALQLEAASPQLTNSVRNGMAILQEAKSEYVAKIHGWFDQTIDRVSQRFTANAHAITFVVALIVAFSVQLDTIALLNRLSTDDAMREFLVKQAPAVAQRAVDKGVAQQKVDATQDENQPATTPTKQDTATQTKTGNAGPGVTASPTPTATPASGNPPGGTGAGNAGGGDKDQATKNSEKAVTDFLQENGLIVPPKWPFSYDAKRSPKFQWELEGNQLLGILLSALLLSLGAPFWYSALQSLLKLRSDVAQKDDAQRASRQVAPQDGGGAPAAPDGGGATVPPSFQGEQGNLQALG